MSKRRRGGRSGSRSSTAWSGSIPAWTRGLVLRRGGSWPTARRGSRPARARRRWRPGWRPACSSRPTSPQPPTNRPAAPATPACRLGGRTEPLPDTCPSCRGRRLSPFGWGVERVEHAVRRRFPDARIARYDPDALRGARGETQRRAAAAAQVVIGTRGALRLFGRAALGLAGFVSPDQLLRLPDFRAGERTLAFLWAAAERVGAGGALVIQSQNPTHYAFEAAARQDLAAFYTPELRFRAELGYPPFRRLAIVTLRGGGAPETERLAERVCAALRASTALQVYPPGADRRSRLRRVVVKGPAELPRLVGAALQEFRDPRPEGRGIIDVEVDPVEWPF